MTVSSPLPLLLFLLFLGLKLAHAVHWSWVWVTAPLWVAFIVYVVLLVTGSQRR